MEIERKNLDTQIIKDEISKFILSNFMPGDDSESLRDDDLLFEGGIIDSVGAVTLVLFLEEHYGFKVLDEELFPENIASVERIVIYVLKKLETSCSDEQKIQFG